MNNNIMNSTDSPQVHVEEDPTTSTPCIIMLHREMTTADDMISDRIEDPDDSSSTAGSDERCYLDTSHGKKGSSADSGDTQNSDIDPSIQQRDDDGASTTSTLVLLCCYPTSEYGAWICCNVVVLLFFVIGAVVVAGIACAQGLCTSNPDYT
ncbi:expressed unknown protein [Seminavis robusta]|uniref:Uncharacterized protein n=1 Tax=Seminavis robusta TaxID=568900 RepID=A0A9N8ENV6_9STRA|nr:expressed unknown protein [Seminavis robusta]|eukprot:Sro1255_g256530.1 n/a (152) ;mRNA; r:28800-29255